MGMLVCVRASIRNHTPAANFWTHGLNNRRDVTAKIADLIVAAEGLMRMDRYELIDYLRFFL